MRNPTLYCDRSRSLGDPMDSTDAAVPIVPFDASIGAGQSKRVPLPPKVVSAILAEIDSQVAALKKGNTLADLEDLARWSAARERWGSKAHFKSEARVWNELPERRWCIEVGEELYVRVWRSGTEFSAQRGEPREYGVSPLPLFRDSTASIPAHQDEVLRMMYSHANEAWKQLTGIRFKLLGLVPAVSVLAWCQLIDPRLHAGLAGRALCLGISLAGLLISCSIRNYDKRNDQLYDDLISRCRSMEDQLGIDTGIFRGRPAKRSDRVNHGWAVAAIYNTVLAGWLVSAGTFLVLVILAVLTSSPPRQPGARAGSACVEDEPAEHARSQGENGAALVIRSLGTAADESSQGGDPARVVVQARDQGEDLSASGEVVAPQAYREFLQGL